VLARLNDAQGSKREREKAIALDPKLGLAYNALGMIYVQEGQVSEAEAAFQRRFALIRNMPKPRVTWAPSMPSWEGMPKQWPFSRRPLRILPSTRSLI